MKNLYKMYIVVVLSVLFIGATNSLFAQTASSTWPLAANQTYTVVGNITSANQSLSTMQVSYSSSAQRSSPTGTAGTWSAETAQNSSRYMQFVASPISGNSFTVSSISLFLYTNSGSYMKANVYYSTDPTFATKTQIGSTYSLGTTAPGSPNVTVAPNVVVNSGQTLYLRIYPWNTTSTTGKYVVTKTVVISGTTSGSTGVPVTGVTVAPTSTSVGVGSTTQLTATVSPSNATNKSVTWTSSNTAVATVSTSGLVTGVAAGSATITVRTADGGFTATSAITVTTTTIAVTGVSVAPTSASVAAGSTVQLTATVSPSNATNKSVTWSSSSTSIATVSSSGLVTGVAAGSATITVRTADGGFTATSAITVTSAQTSTIYQAENGTWSSGGVLETVNAGYTGTGYVNGANSTGAWVEITVNAATAGSYTIQYRYANGTTTDRPSNISVNGTQVISNLSFAGTGAWTTWSLTAQQTIALNAGSNTIRATATTANGPANIDYLSVGGGTSTVAVTGVSVAPTSASVGVGSTAQLTATVSPSNATNKSVTWTSSSTSIATVSSSGLVTGVMAGSATITVRTADGGFTATSAITVTTTTVAVTGVSVAPTSASVAAGSTVQLTATVSPSNATNKSVTWTSSSTSIATVSSSGLVTGVAAGSATITVRTADGGFTATSAITVTTATVAVTGVSVAPATATVNVGATVQLTATVSPSNATNKSVTWSSSSTSIATVSASGLVTGVAAGSATVTVRTSDGGFTATSSITVSSTPPPAGNYYVATNGSDSNPGTLSSPFATITKAISVAAAGNVIYVRGGTYNLTTTISISKSGTSGSRISLFAYPGERPILNFAGMSDADANRGINLTGSYWYIKGIDIKGAGDNGMWMSGSNNILENCAFYENRDSGLQISGGGANNQITNCDSYYNVDSGQGNADGFSPKLDVGTGNYFKGCRSWQNSDDGYDGYLRPSDDITTTYENCWCFKNGYLKSGSASSGNGNGFKMGGSDNKDLRHNVIYKNCLSFNNRVKGFDQNSDIGSLTLYNCTAFSNGTNYNITTALASGKTLTLTNCVSAGTGAVNLGSFAVQTTNSWMSPFVVSNADFISVDPAAAYGPRNADGSLPTITFMHLASGSDLIDAGTNVGLPYSGSKPDLGCFETGLSKSIPDQHIAELPKGFQLGQNYPNPFNPTTQIDFNLAEAGHVSLKIYDMLGREVATLVNEYRQAGMQHSVSFDASKLSSGLYVYRLQAGNNTIAKKMTLMK